MKNTLFATSRGLIALIENNYNEDRLINIPKVLRSYMGGKTRIEAKK